MSSTNANPPIDYVVYFEELIIIQEKAITSFKRWGSGFVLIGVVIIITALILNPRFQAIVSPMIGIGGIFIGALATFPYREISPRRSKIVTFLLIKRGFENFSQLSDEDRGRLLDLASETVRKQM